MIRKGSRILIVRDGKDKQDSPARRSEQKGVDYLLQAGMKVSITDTPADTDVNILLKNPADYKPNLQAGRRKVRQLLNKSVAAALSFEGRVSQLTELPKTAYEQARLRVAKEYGVRVKHVDREVAAEYRRLHPPPVTEREEEEDLGKPVEDPPWTEPVNLAVALDEHVQETRRYLVAPKHYCDLSSLWTAGTHCVHSEVIWLSVMAQIGATSLGPSAGKSVWLQCIAASACRGMVRSSYTASTLFRRIHQYQVTPCLSELHDILHPANRELLAIIKACHRRDEAYVDRTENLADGSRVARTYFCWAALAWAAIGLPPREVIERSIILPLKPALPSERDKLRRGSPKKSRVFARVRRHFAAWAQGVKSLPDPPMPAWLYNREGQNWWVLFSIAELAGGDWPERIRIAAEKLRALDRPEAFEVRLLAGVQNAFTDSESSKGPAQQLERLSTHELLERLRQQEDLGLREANNYRDLTEYWLRENLRGLITDPNHSQEWREGNGKDPPKHVRGYYRSQFIDAFGRYLENGGAHPGAEPSGASGTSGISPEKRQATAIFRVGLRSIRDRKRSGTSSGARIITG